jgi:tRNA(Phe) wybutosine-synthesizing methylase Tyw3
MRKRVKQQETSEHVSHSEALQCANPLLDFMCQSGFEYSNITSARNIQTVMRSVNNLQKQTNIREYLSKYMSVVRKYVKWLNNLRHFVKNTKQNILYYLCFSMICVSHPLH